MPKSQPLKKKLKILVVLFFLLPCGLWSTASEKNHASRWTYAIGITYSHQNTKIELGDNLTRNSLTYASFSLVLRTEFSPYLTLDLIAGSNNYHIGNPVDFLQLPLSLRFHSDRTRTLNYGLAVTGKIGLVDNFSIRIGGRCLWVKKKEQTSTFDLDIVSGTALSNQSFSEFTLDVSLEYRPLNTLTLFAGPQLNRFSGDYEVTEILQYVRGTESLAYEQARLIGMNMGIIWKLGSDFTFEITASALSKTQISAAIFYRFKGK